MSMSLSDIAKSKFEKILDRLSDVEITYIAGDPPNQQQYTTNASFRELGPEFNGRHKAEYAEITMRRSIVAEISNQDLVVIDNSTWRVEKLIEASAGISRVLIRKDESVAP